MSLDSRIKHALVIGGIVAGSAAEVFGAGQCLNRVAAAKEARDEIMIIDHKINLQRNEIEKTLAGTPSPDLSKQFADCEKKLTDCEAQLRKSIKLSEPAHDFINRRIDAQCDNFEMITGIDPSVVCGEIEGMKAATIETPALKKLIPCEKRALSCMNDVADKINE
ncbi:MAG: hypothetical protein WC843_00425 [Candidatus Gracilibacteria bacterium]|jgi:hypothetical protein